MKIIMISTDRNLLIPDSAVVKRFEDYSKVFDELHVIVFTKKGFKKTQISSNVFVYPTNSFSKIQYISNAVKIGSKISADLVSAQDCFLTGLAAYKISQLKNIKFHLQIHTDIFSDNFKKHSFLNNAHSFIAKLLLEKADGIRVVSKRIYESLKTLKLKADPVILPIAIDLEKMNKEQLVVEKKSVYNILTVARFEKEKNVTLAIEAFEKVSRYLNNVDMTIVGSGSLKDDLESLARNLGVFEKINFVGSVDNVQDYYKNADIYIQTSKYEGYGMSLIEAAYVGLPIATTDVGVVGEVLIDGGSCLVAKENAVDFSEKIIKLLDDDVLRQSLGDRAKESAMKNVLSKEEYLGSFKKAFSI